ncbi:uncharacterized protein LOC128017457 isoform X3 [Carassius gibelio]|uniref:uncharacterized protein LOC128017457 isoform X3 n=1 Tax=Carassius gibelio TaxID=101364 RepID=UPI00227866F9|nr:uncharacterized protein LOC128017457 isoform X3 [Carassius gibelio]
MNIFLESRCSILAVLLVFLLQGSCADPDVELHRAVGDSLELIADYPKKDLEVLWKYNIITFAEYQNDDFQEVKSELFSDRLKMNKDSISVTVTDLKLQDSGRFSIVAENKSGQYKTKGFVLHVHALVLSLEVLHTALVIDMIHLHSLLRTDGGHIRSCADPDVELHRAVGDSLELITDYPKKDLEVLWKYNIITFAEYQNNDFQEVKSELFNDRLKMNKDSISVIVTDLKLQDSGRFSIVAENKSGQYKTKGFVLHVHALVLSLEVLHTALVIDMIHLHSLLRTDGGHIRSCADPDVELHRAVGDSLELIADYPKKDLEVLWKYNMITFAEYQNDDFQEVKCELFNDRLKMNKDSISVIVTDLKLQDSGRFSIVAENKSGQYKTKGFVLHVHGSCADPDVELHRAVGDSLELIADYPKKDLEVLWKYNIITFAEYQNDDFQEVKCELFNDRLKMNKDSISVTVTDLKLQDSGRFSIVAENKSGQYKTKGFVLHVHALVLSLEVLHTALVIDMIHLHSLLRTDGGHIRSCADPDVELHRAVGDSLELIADYPKKDLEVDWKYNLITFAAYRNDDFQKVKSELFSDRLKMNKDSISVTITDLKLQDSGRFSIVAENKTGPVQLKTKEYVLRVHELIRDVQIEDKYLWLPSKNICMFNLRCVASGDENPSYSWISRQTQGSQLNISLSLGENTTLSCSANNTVSIKYTTKTVVCTEKTNDSTSGSLREFVLIAAGVGIVAVVILGATLAVCCRWRRNRGQGESEAGITVYEDVNIDAPAKKRSESVVNGMTIYETVDDAKLSQNLPQTLYDKINYQRQPAGKTSTSTPSSYQEVL